MLLNTGFSPRAVGQPCVQRQSRNSIGLLLYRRAVTIRVLLKYLLLVPELAPCNAGTLCITTYTVIGLVSITYFVCLFFFLKPPSAFSTLKYISYYGNSDVTGGGEG